MFGCLCIGSIRVTDLGLNGGRIEGPCLSHARREKRRRWYKQARQPNTGQHVSSGESHRVMVAAADPRQVRRLATNADWQDMPDPHQAFDSTVFSSSRGAPGAMARIHRRQCSRACEEARRPALKRDDFSSNRHLALGYSWSMIFSENRCPLFRDPALTASIFYRREISRSELGVLPSPAGTGR